MLRRVCRGRRRPCGGWAPILAAWCLLAATGGARAGHYANPSNALVPEPTYAGGTIQPGSTAYSPQSVPGIPGATGWGGVTIGSGTRSCGGPITATWKWYPQDGDPTDLPPSNILIQEYCLTSWSGSGMYMQPTGSYNNPLPFPGWSTQWGTFPTLYAQGNASGIRYRVVPGTDPLVVNCSPSANVSGGSVLPGSASVTYYAHATPADITFTGGIGPSYAQRYLIGLPATAAFGAGLSPDANGCTWSVAGGGPFKDFLPDNSNSHFVALDFGTEKGTSLAYYYADGSGGSSTVTCSATLAIPPGCQPAGGLPVTASRSCAVVAPSVERVLPAVGQTGIWDLPDDPLCKFLTLGPYTITVNNVVFNAPAGVGWAAKVTTLAEWLAAYGPGQCAFVQTISVVVSYQTDRPPTGWYDSRPSGEGLDGSFPYPASMRVTGTPPSTEAPQIACNGDWLLFQDWPDLKLDPVHDTQGSYSFAGTSYLMHQPGGATSRWVPLYKWPWSWAGTATLANGTYTLSAAQNPSPSGCVEWHDHPTWAQNVTITFVHR